MKKIDEWNKFKYRGYSIFLYCIALIHYTISTTYIFYMCFSNKKRQELKDKLEERQNLLHPILVKYINHVSKIK